MQLDGLSSSRIFPTMIAEQIPQIQNLSESDKWELMVELEEELWRDDRVGAQADTILAELERRKQHFENHPESAMTLEVARRRMFASRA